MSSPQPLEPNHDVLVVRPSKWTLVVIVELADGARRFNELRRQLGGVSQKTLSGVLRELERDGFVSRSAYATIPPRVDYALTDMGAELLEIAQGWHRFALRNRTRVEAARRLFDGTIQSAD